MRCKPQYTFLQHFYALAIIFQTSSNAYYQFATVFNPLHYQTNTCSRTKISEWHTEDMYFSSLWSWASFFGITSFTYTYYLSCLYDELELLLLPFNSVFRRDFFLDLLGDEPDIPDLRDGERNIFFY